MSTYADFDKLLMRGTKPVPSRKVANNTYAVRLPSVFGNAIGIKLHDTFVVTFYEEGTIKLDSGGWLTMTTKERMNRFLPAPLTVHSIKGRWMVTTRSADDRPDYEHSTPYVDGMKLAQMHRPGRTEGGPWVVANGLAPADQASQDAHNARIEKLIDAYLRWLTAERYEVIFQDGPRVVSNCGMCVRTDVGVLVGDAFEDKQHLIEHLIDKDLPFNVFWVAADHSRSADGLMRARFFDMVKRDLRKYLRSQLYVGPIATKGGKRPAHTPPWQLSRELDKSMKGRKPA